MEHRCHSFKLLKNYRSVPEVITASRSILKPRYMQEKNASASTEDFFQDEDSLDSDDGKLGEFLQRADSML